MGVGPANLRDITFRQINGGVSKYITGGEIFDSGSWLGYTVTVATAAFSGSNFIQSGTNRCYFRNRNVPFGDAERALFDMYIESISNDPSDVYSNYCNPKVRFAFINNYGVYDYYSFSLLYVLNYKYLLHLNNLH